MKVFQELTILTQGDPNAVERIEAALPVTWRRDKDREDQSNHSPSTQIYAFIQRTALFDNAFLVLRNDDLGLAVSNIVPLHRSEFSIDEYNAVLMDFVAILKSTQYEIRLGKSEVELTDLIGPDLAYKLRAFSSLANKSTGHSHPSDEKRWLDWMFSMVRDHQTIEFEALVFFLRQQGWGEESAYQLALDYSYGSRAMEYALENA